MGQSRLTMNTEAFWPTFCLITFSLKKVRRSKRYRCWYCSKCRSVRHRIDEAKENQARSR